MALLPPFVVKGFLRTAHGEKSTAKESVARVGEQSRSEEMVDFAEEQERKQSSSSVLHCRPSSCRAPSNFGCGSHSFVG